jgi:predicted DNA-binding protein with PD1-like motif
MKFSEAKPGRIFVLRLEDGEILHEQIEAFARSQSIQSAALIVLGGADEGSRLVVGPEQGRGLPVIPMEIALDGVHEVMGTGTIFPDLAGNPVLHMHVSGGRKDRAKTGCVRRGVKVWHVMEAVLWEISESTAKRVMEPATGFELLQP